MCVVSLSIAQNGLEMKTTCMPCGCVINAVVKLTVGVGWHWKAIFRFNHNFMSLGVIGQVIKKNKTQNKKITS